MIKVVTVNSEGIVELTKEELEEMLNEAYENGKKDGNHYYAPIMPSYTEPRKKGWREDGPTCQDDNLEWTIAPSREKHWWEKVTVDTMPSVTYNSTAGPAPHTVVYDGTVQVGGPEENSSYTTTTASSHSNCGGTKPLTW